MSFIPSAVYLPYIMHIEHGQRRHLKGAFNAIIPRVLTVIGTGSLYIGCVAATIALLYAALNINKWLTLASMKYYMDLSVCSFARSPSSSISYAHFFSFETAFILFVWFGVQTKERTLKLNPSANAFRCFFLLFFFVVLLLSLLEFQHRMFGAQPQKWRQLTFFRSNMNAYVHTSMHTLVAHCKSFQGFSPINSFLHFSSFLRN